MAIIYLKVAIFVYLYNKELIIIHNISNSHALTYIRLQQKILFSQHITSYTLPKLARYLEKLREKKNQLLNIKLVCLEVYA